MSIYLKNAVIWIFVVTVLVYPKYSLAAGTTWISEDFPEFMVKILATVFLVLITIFIISMAGTWREKYESYNLRVKQRVEREREMSVNRITFADVVGLDEVKESLKDVLGFLKDPSAFREIGARIPTGMLLEGEPGNGKTMMARALAGEARVPFFFLSGPELVDNYGEKIGAHVRSLFKDARKYPCSIIFIDEFDSVASSRSGKTGAINQLLVEMDGFMRNKSSRIFVIAATNNGTELEPALLRSGRLDRKVIVPSPDLSVRNGILKINTAGVKVHPDFDVNSIGVLTAGLSGADMALIPNEAALYALRRNSKIVQDEDFREAVNSVMLGHRRDGYIPVGAARRLIAYHEAGHAIVSFLIPYGYMPGIVTLNAHGKSSKGSFISLEEEGKTQSLGRMKAQLAIYMAGRVAEEIMLENPDDVTSGASHDIKMAFLTARTMIVDSGFSESGFFLAKDEPKPESVNKRLDDAIQERLKKAVHVSRSILETNRAALDSVATLLEDSGSVAGEVVSATIVKSGGKLPENFRY